MMKDMNIIAGPVVDLSSFQPLMRSSSRQIILSLLLVLTNWVVYCPCARSAIDPCCFPPDDGGVLVANDLICLIGAPTFLRVKGVAVAALGSLGKKLSRLRYRMLVSMKFDPNQE